MRNYVERAKHFVRQIDVFLSEGDIFAVEHEINTFNRSNHRSVRVRFGATRIALLTSDYVIKFDRADACEDNVETFGNCEREYNFYQFAERSGFGYLFAPITKVKGYHRNYYIMPLVRGIGRGNDYIGAYLTEEELEFVEVYLFDIHEYNYGFKNRKPCIIDYAACN